MAKQTRRMNEPEPGHYLVRLTKGGPLVAARIVYQPATDPVTGQLLDRSWYWWAWIDGRLIAEPSPSWVASGVDRIWHSGERCTPHEYNRRLKLKDWAERSAPFAPEANADKPIDLNELPPLI